MGEYLQWCFTSTTLALWELYTWAPSQTYLGVMLVELQGCTAWEETDCFLQPKIITLCLTDSQVRIYVKQHQTPLVFKVNVLWAMETEMDLQKKQPHSCQPSPAISFSVGATSRPTNKTPHQGPSTSKTLFWHMILRLWSDLSFFEDRCWGQGVSCRAKRKAAIPCYTCILGPAQLVSG